MSMKDTVKAAIETVLPPSLDELRQRLKAARQDVVAREGARNLAQSNLEAAYAGTDDTQTLRLESDLTQARLALDRASGRVTALERLVAAAEMAQTAAANEAGRKRLAALVTARDRVGTQIDDALVALELGVSELAVIDTDITALPVSVRGVDCVPGLNLGRQALDRQIGVALSQRGINGQESSIAFTRFAAWLSTGTELLRGRV